ncbi:hypothetical protein GCM10023221_29750 [Luteimicrobium xylanilyticum]
MTWGFAECDVAGFAGGCGEVVRAVVLRPWGPCALLDALHAPTRSTVPSPTRRAAREVTIGIDGGSGLPIVTVHPLARVTLGARSVALGARSVALGARSGRAVGALRVGLPPACDGAAGP